MSLKNSLWNLFLCCLFGSNKNRFDTPHHQFKSHCRMPIFFWFGFHKTNCTIVPSFPYANVHNNERNILICSPITVNECSEIRFFQVSKSILIMSPNGYELKLTKASQKTRGSCYLWIIERSEKSTSIITSMGVTIVTYYRKTIVVMHICTVVYTQCTTQTLRFNLLAGGNQNIAFVYFSRARCCCCLFFGWCDRFFRYYKSENRLTNLGSRRLSRFHKWNTISPIVIFFSSQKKFFLAILHRYFV